MQTHVIDDHHHLAGTTLKRSSNEMMDHNINNPTTTFSEQQQERKKKKKKINNFTIEPYEKKCNDGLFILPNELFMHIFSYLVGDLMSNLDISTIETNVEKASNIKEEVKDEEEEEDENNEHPIHPNAITFIPPFDNLKAIIRLNVVCRDFQMMIVGNCTTTQNNHQHDGGEGGDGGSEEQQLTTTTMNDFELFWLRGFNFYFKFLYWIRTRKLDTMTLAQGDLTQKNYIENARAQNTILHYERGKALKSFESTFDYYDLDDMDYLEMDAEECEEEDAADSESIIEKNENTSEEVWESYKKVFNSRKPLYNNEQQSKEQILKRFRDLEIDPPQYIKNFRILETNEKSFQLCFDVMMMISLRMFDTFDTEDTDMYEGGSSIPISHQYLNCWDSGERREANERECKDVENKIVGTSIANCGGYAKFLTNSKAEEEEFTQLNSTIMVNTTPSCVEINREHIVNQLSRSIFLNLENVLIFKPLENFAIPSSVKFLSIDLNSPSSYKNYPTELFIRDLFYENCTLCFPGVKYLRLRNVFTELFQVHSNVVTHDDFQKKVLQFATNKKIFPNLRYLSLNGFSLSENPTECMDFEFMKQLIGLDISFNNECRESSVWNSFRKLTMLLSKKSNCLRHVTLETQIDSRNFSTLKLDSILEKLYNNHKKPFSVGFVSVSQYYAVCGE